MGQKDKEEMTIIELDKNDVAFIMRGDMSLEGVLPQMNGDDLVPDNVRLVAGLMILLGNEETFNIIMEMINDAFEEGIKTLN